MRFLVGSYTPTGTNVSSIAMGLQLQIVSHGWFEMEKTNTSFLKKPKDSSIYTIKPSRVEAPTMVFDV